MRSNWSHFSTGKSSQRRAELHASIVDEDVDRADFVLDAVDAKTYRLGIGHVEVASRHSGASLSLCRVRPRQVLSGPDR